MDEQPTTSAAEAFRAEQARRGVALTDEGGRQAQARLDAHRATWSPQRFAAMRARSERAAEDLRAGHTQSPAA